MIPIDEIPFPPSARFTRPARVCFALPEFGQFHKRGGIGTAFDAFAHALVKAGHEVTTLLCDPTTLSPDEFSTATANYAANGIRVVPLPELLADATAIGTPDIIASYRAWHWLRTQTFDVIHFAEWKGCGFHSISSKRAGLDFANTQIIVSTRSPSRWCREGNQQILAHYDEFLTDYMEQRSVELADKVFVPSLHAAEWTQNAGWKLPSDTFLQRNLFRPPDGVKPLTFDPKIAISEIVFFGRLEPRKGLDLFCEAIGKLDPQSFAGKQITFLGHHAANCQFDSAQYIAAQFTDSPINIRILSDYARAEALAHLARPGVLAVIPTRLDIFPNALMECLALHIPILAANTSTVPELIPNHDRERILFEPNAAALAEKLKMAISDPPSPAQCAFDPAENERRWIEWHNALTVTPSSPASEQRPPLATPKVSVCMAHYNQPEFLRQAIASLEVQTYSNFEVIVVDDGSTHPDAAKTLDELESRITPRGWKIIRQENRYVGAARNAAAGAANGEYLMFMDDDNVAMPHEIATFVHAALTANAPIVVCPMKMFTGQANPEQTPNISYDLWLYHLGGPLSGALFENPLGDTNFFINRDLYFQLGGFDEDPGLSSAEDKRFLAVALLNGNQILAIPQPLYWYRVRPDSKWRLPKNKLRERQLTTELFLKHIPPSLHDGFNYLHLRQHQRIQELQQQVASAEKWQRSWIRRIFHRWRANEKKKCVSNFKKLIKERNKTTPSANKKAQKRVLVIDFQIPTPDRDSGGQRMAQLLYVLRDLNFRVTFIPFNLKKIEGYTESLQQANIEVLFDPLIKNIERYLSKEGDVFDTVIISRVKYMQFLGKTVRKFAPSARLIFDTCDLHFLRESRAAELANDDLKRQAAEKLKEIEMRCIAYADETWVVSELERSLLVSEGVTKPVVLITNIQPIFGAKKPFNERKDFLFIGGFAHQPNPDAVHYFLEKIFPTIHERLPDARFFIIGAHIPVSIKMLASPWIKVLGHQPNVDTIFNNIKLSIAPLRYGAGVKGKVNQSLSFGVPVVATPIAVEGMGLVAGDDVLVAENEEAFASAVIELYQNEALWNRLSQNGLSKIQELYSPEAIRKQVAARLNKTEPR